MMSKPLSSCFEKVKKLPVRKQRCVAAIVGAHVADAASRPLHWVYKLDVLKDALSTVDVPEFYPESKCPFYQVELGKTSMYNDNVRVALGYLESTAAGQFTNAGLGEAFNEKCGPGTPVYEHNKERKNLPITGTWLHGTIKKLVEDLSSGQTPRNEGSDDNDAILAALPLLLTNESSDTLWKELKDVILMFTQHSPTITWFHAFAVLLVECVDGNVDPLTSFKDKLKSVHPEMLEKIEAMETSSLDFVENVKENGYACSLPGSFLGAYLAMQKTSSFQEAVRLNITAGGDSCSRGNVIGACYGALYGVESIPLDWMERVIGIEETFEKAIAVAQR